MNSMGRPALATDIPVNISIPIVEIPTASRHSEARAAMAVVTGLLDAGVHRRDVAIVVRDLDEYESELTAPAIRHDIPPEFWTQIQLTNTQLYHLLETVCELLGATKVARVDLAAVLALGWTPPDPDDEWPMHAQSALDALSTPPADRLSVADWQAAIAESAWPRSRVTELLEWLATVGEPTPQTVATGLGGIVQRYREIVLPTVKENDTPALMKTQSAARATVRLASLVEETVAKYRRRISAGQIDPAWSQVMGILESIATQSPGRREHANAQAIDIVEANDIWARDIPYVVAMGLIDGIWPQDPARFLPVSMQQAIVSGDDETSALVPRTRWDGGREVDQFVETLETPSQGLVVTRHTQTSTGTDQTRSPLLETVDTQLLDRSARRRLLGKGTELPDALRATLTNTTTDGGSDQ